MNNISEISGFDNSWFILEDKYGSDTSKHFEGLFTQGNGYMHVRGSYEEGLRGAPQDEDYLRMPANVTLEKPRHPESKWGTYIPGIVGMHPLLKEEIVNLPYFLCMNLTVSDEVLDMKNCTIREYKRWLDLRNGCLFRSFIWQTKSGMDIRLTYMRFISMEHKHLSLQQINMEVLSGQGELDIECGINYGVRTNGFNHFQKVSASATETGCISVETVTDSGNRVLMMSCVNASENIQWKKLQKDKSIAFCGSKQMKPGDCLRIQKATSVVTDRDIEDGSLAERGQKYLMAFCEEGWEKIYESHSKAWKEKWDLSDIKITGDEKAQLAIRASLYHLIRSNGENDPRIAICAKGYAGEAYFGRYFWDTEINMLPFFIHTNPKAARNLIMFRYNTLDGARKNAEAYGYNGARYAWESSVSGEEQCPNWQYGDHEVHITADIVYALCHYVNATGDFGLVEDYGIDVMVETARYWVSRVDANKKGYYDLLGVMGPDEYLPMTMNNAFTNRMVQFSLNKTLEYLDTIRKNNASKYADIEKRLEIQSNDIAKFKDVAEKLMIPYDGNTEVVPQSEDFHSYADLDFDTIWKDRTKPFGHFISQERNYRSKALKQADVIELMMLYPEDFSREQIIKAYNYYEPITTHDSSFQLLFCRFPLSNPN
ncbi:MAG TPA: glycoside hydrolase family 65 protein, partial [Ruminiclostridium sp.]|nr:glycoside hydrolase family 65 protein [Ruminiclostridium sp.]